MLRTLFIALVLLAPTFASAQSEAPEDYLSRVHRGVTELAAGDTDAASATFREALASDGSRPEAQYYLAALARVTGDLEGALTAFQQAATLAEAAGEPRWQARALQGVASTLERIEGRVEQARSAWQAYATFARANPSVAEDALAAARIQAIDIMNEQERAYVEVRERIAEREAERAREAEEED